MTCEREKSNLEGDFKLQRGREYGAPGEKPAAAGGEPEQVSHLAIVTTFGKTLYREEQLSHVIDPHDSRARCPKT